MAQAEREAIASCPNLKCGKPVWSDQSDAWCHECGEYFPEDLVARLPRITERLTRSTQSGGEGSGESLGNATPRVRAVMTRYRDAYRVSNAISRAGDSIKGAGVLLAVVFALFGLIAASQVGIL